MRLNNPISQFRQRSLARNSPIGPGQGGFRGTMNFGPSEPEPEPEPPLYQPQQVPMQTGGFRGLFGGQAPPNVTSQIEFGGSDAIQAPNVTAHGPNDRASQFYELLEKMRNRETPGLSAYREALNNVPTPDQYKPNWLTRIASGLSGFSAGMKDAGRGVETAMNLNRSGYESALSDYSNRLGTLKEQATMEEAANRSEMDSIHKAYQMGLDYDKLGLEKTKADATIRQGDIRAGAAATTAGAAVRRAEIAAEELKTKGITSTPQRDGSLQVFDSKTGQSKIIPGNSLAAFVAESGRTSANAAASNAATNAGQLKLDQEIRPRLATAAEANAGANFYKSVINPPEPQGRDPYISAGASETARDAAIKILMDDPTWSEFTGGEPGDFDPEEWKLYQAKIEEVANGILNKRRGGP